MKTDEKVTCRTIRGITEENLKEMNIRLAPRKLLMRVIKAAVQVTYYLLLM